MSFLLICNYRFRKQGKDGHLFLLRLDRVAPYDLLDRLISEVVVKPAEPAAGEVGIYNFEQFSYYMLKLIMV